MVVLLKFRYSFGFLLKPVTNSKKNPITLNKGSVRWNELIWVNFKLNKWIYINFLLLAHSSPYMASCEWDREFIKLVKSVLRLQTEELTTSFFVLDDYVTEILCRKCLILLKYETCKKPKNFFLWYYLILLKPLTPQI